MYHDDSMSLVVKEKIPTFDFIINNIYLGDKEAAESQSLLSLSNIQVIVNISNSRYSEFDGINYIHYDIDDDKNANITQFFEKLDNIISSNKEKNILIHCMNSVSRSVTLVLYYLLHDMNLNEAFNFLKSKRAQYTKPNSGFIKQLLECEKNKYGSNSMKLSDFYLKE